MQASIKFPRLRTGKYLFCFILLVKASRKTAPIQSAENYALPLAQESSKLTLQGALTGLSRQAMPNRKRRTSGCVLSPCLFNFYAEYIMRSAGLEEAQAGIKIAGRNINHLRYADDTTLMAESEEELKSL